MDSSEETPNSTAGKPRTVTVIGLFAAAAALISYLVAYAFTDALVKAEFLAHWQPGHDPRPTRFLIGFGLLMSLFTATAGAMRFAGRSGASEEVEEHPADEPEAFFPYADSQRRDTSEPERK